MPGCSGCWASTRARTSTHRRRRAWPGPTWSGAAGAGPAGTGVLATEDAAGRFGMHDLLRIFARQMCQEADHQATRVSAYDLCCRMAYDLM